MPRKKSREKSSHPLSERYSAQTRGRSAKTRSKMYDTWALTFRPGDTSNTFLGKGFLPQGSPVAIIQYTVPSSHPDATRTRAEKGKRRRGRREAVKWDDVPLRGYTSCVDPKDATVYLGTEDTCCFSYNFGLRPHPGARSEILDPRRNPSLVSCALDMDTEREKAVSRNYRLRRVPQLPTYFLAFAEHSRPPMEDTPALRAAVASHMQKPVEYVDAMEASARTAVLQAEWYSRWLPPTDPLNNVPGGLWLINQQLSTYGRSALRVYEWYDDLCGVDIRNVARDIIDPQDKLPNPSRSVAKKLKISYDDLLSMLREGGAGTDGRQWSDDEVMDTFARMEKEIRRRIGLKARLCDQDDIIMAIGHPDEPIVPSGIKSPLETLGEATAVKLMRKLAKRHADCLHDEDILRALEKPSQPLYARGLARVQVLRMDQRDVQGSLRLTERLASERIQVDFAAVPEKWRKERETAPSTSAK